jgi:hypothetical protein
MTWPMVSGWPSTASMWWARSARGNGPAAADVVPGRGAVVLGGRLAGEPWRPQDGPVQAGVAQQVFHRGEVVVDLAEQRLGGPHADMPHDEPVAGIVARRVRPAG